MLTRDPNVYHTTALYLWHGVGGFLPLAKVVQQMHEFHIHTIIVGCMQDCIDSFQKLFCKLCVHVASLQIVQFVTYKNCGNYLFIGTQHLATLLVRCFHAHQYRQITSNYNTKYYSETSC